MATRSGKLTRILGGMGLAALASFGSTTEAALVFDIRLADGSKAVTLAPSDVGRVLNYDVFVTVTGTDANPANDTIQSAYGYIRSVGGLHGDLTHVNEAAFSVNNDSDGAAADRDGDTDIDIGGAGTFTNTAGQIHYRAGAQTPAPTPLKIGSGTFTVKDLAGPTNLTFFLAAPNGLNRNPSFVIDGVTRSGDNASLIQVGAPIVLSTEIIGGVDAALETVPDQPTFNLVVVKGLQNGQYTTPNPLNAGDELPAGGVNAGGVVIAGIEPTASPVFILIGLNNENGLDGKTLVGGGTLVSEADPNFVALKQHYPFLDALVRFDGDADRAFNFDFSDIPGLMVTEIAAVPEPTVLGLASIAGLGLLVRRRRNA